MARNTESVQGKETEQTGSTLPENYEVEKIAFESKQPDRGYTCKASYLKKPNAGDALIEIFKDGALLRQFLFPAYKIWNIAAHFGDIVDGEIAESAKGYEMAAWDGISGAILVKGEPAPKSTPNNPHVGKT